MGWLCDSPQQAVTLDVLSLKEQELQHEVLMLRRRIRKLPHSGFRGQTPDEMYYGRGDHVPRELEQTRLTAHKARLETNRGLYCTALSPRRTRNGDRQFGGCLTAGRVLDEPADELSMNSAYCYSSEKGPGRDSCTKGTIVSKSEFNLSFASQLGCKPGRRRRGDGNSSLKVQDAGADSSVRFAG